MIPKIIHYCWFGGKEKPDIVKEYIQGWRKLCPDYRIMEWNEKNFNISQSIPYVQEAYAEKKWAFVADYVRLYALVQWGGIYFDTDIELLKPVEHLLNNHMFLGYEMNGVATGVIGSEKGNMLLKDFCDLYQQRHFKLESGELDLLTINSFLNQYLERFGFTKNNCNQTVGAVTIYPSEFFYPLMPNGDKILVTENTVTVHHYAGTWLSVQTKYQIELQNKISRFLPKRFSIWIAVLLSEWKVNGVKQMFVRLLERIKR